MSLNREKWNFEVVSTYICLQQYTLICCINPVKFSPQNLIMSPELIAPGKSIKSSPFLLAICTVYCLLNETSDPNLYLISYWVTFYLISGMNIIKGNGNKEGSCVKIARLILTTLHCTGFPQAWNEIVSRKRTYNGVLKCTPTKAVSRW